MKAVLTDHCHERSPVLKDHIFLAIGPTPVTKTTCLERPYFYDPLGFQDRFHCKPNLMVRLPVNHSHLSLFLSRSFRSFGTGFGAGLFLVFRLLRSVDKLEQLVQTFLIQRVWLLHRWRGWGSYLLLFRNSLLLILEMEKLWLSRYCPITYKELATDHPSHKSTRLR